MNLKVATVMLCGMMAVSIGGFTQSNAAFPPPDARSGPPHDPARELARLTKDLQLTAEQQTQIKPILEARESQMHSLREDTSLTREAEHSKARSIMEQTDSSIEALLDANQKAKFEKQRRAMREHARSRDNTSSPDGAPGPDGDGPPGGDGPPPDGPPGI